MEFIRKQEVVEAFHFDLKKDAEVTPQMNFSIEPLEKGTLALEKEVASEVLITLQFVIVLDQIVISGRIGQGVGVVDRVITAPTDFPPRDALSLTEPILEMVQRLTYEVTEVALDRPGIQLNFEQIAEDNDKNK